jgi:hypothetical protein
MDISDPAFDPHNCSIEDKIRVVELSDGLLIDLLAGCKIKRNLGFRYCKSLTHLPDNLEVGEDLWIVGCTSLTHLSDSLKVGGNLWLINCIGLQHYRDKKIKGVKGRMYIV